MRVAGGETDPAEAALEPYLIIPRPLTRLSEPQFGQSRLARMPDKRGEIGFRAFQRSHRRSASQGPLAVAARSLFAPEVQWASGRNRMLTFRVAITAAVMTFVTALTACLIFIQIATFHAAARAAASAAMDAASANTLSRLEAEVSELNTVVRVLSSTPALADSDDRSEVGGPVGLNPLAPQRATG